MEIKLNERRVREHSTDATTINNFWSLWLSFFKERNSNRKQKKNLSKKRMRKSLKKIIDQSHRSSFSSLKTSNVVFSKRFGCGNPFQMNLMNPPRDSESWENEKSVPKLSNCPTSSTFFRRFFSGLRWE
jgi:hypothetical protein